jgi:hypothetical protein
LEPLRIFHGLLSGQNFHETITKTRKIIGTIEVTIEGSGIKLRQHIDFVNLGVNTIADGNID